MTMADNKCEVCNEREPIAVACVPGLPMSVAYCRECATAGASPYWAIVMNVAMIGGVEHVAEWYKEEIDRTLAHLKKDRAQFEIDVAKAIVDQREDEERYFAEQEAKDREKFYLWASGEGYRVFSRGDTGNYIVPALQTLWEEFQRNGAMTPAEIKKICGAQTPTASTMFNPHRVVA